MRDYAVHAHEQGKCLLCGEELLEGILCESCREEFEEVD